MNEQTRQTALSAYETSQFRDDGFLVIEDVFSSSEIELLRAACSAPEDTAWQSSEGTIHSLGLTQRHPAFLDLARDPRIVDRLESLIGPHIQLQHSKLAAKPLRKNAGPFGWHQDFAYFPHTNTDLVAAMVTLDDHTPENGCMSMVRGSHKLGLLNHLDAEGYFTFACREPLWEQQPELVAQITPRAGGLSIHHCLTLHGSPTNRSGLPRRGIVFQYRASDAFQLADTIFSDTGLIIRGDTNLPVRCEAASWHLPRYHGRENRGFGGAWHQEGAYAATINDSSSHEA